MIDVRIEDHGSIYVFQPMVGTVTQWIRDNVQTEPWQWLGGGLCVDHHCAADLAGILIENGFTLGDTEDRDHHHQ